jgi:hypothetical protein
LTFKNENKILKRNQNLVIQYSGEAKPIMLTLNELVDQRL